eukprot:NODE_393_length_9450_cov_0.506791.p6 type:complete len:139 gc:universal NODE_393_length_9450_cov_0.506791:791-375(-)
MRSLSFCRECGNLLYPEEDKEAKILNMRCKNCDYITVAESTLIYRNELKHDDLRGSGSLNQDTVFDMTLPKISKGCPDCKTVKAIYFSNRSTSKNADLRLTFLCTGCKNPYSEEDYKEKYLSKPIDAMEEDEFEDLGL